MARPTDGWPFEGAAEAVVLVPELDAGNVAEADDAGRRSARPAAHRRGTKHGAAGGAGGRAADRQATPQAVGAGAARWWAVAPPPAVPPPLLCAPPVNVAPLVVVTVPVIPVAVVPVPVVPDVALPMVPGPWSFPSPSPSLSVVSLAGQTRAGARGRAAAGRVFYPSWLVPPADPVPDGLLKLAKPARHPGLLGPAAAGKGDAVVTMARV